MERCDLQFWETLSLPGPAAALLPEHLQRPLPRRCHQPASLAARENRGCGSDPRSEAARPGPLRATSTATNRAPALERGRGWAAADQRVGARGRSSAPRPTCWLPALVPEAPELPRISDHRDRLLQAMNRQSGSRPADATPRGIPAILPEGSQAWGQGGGGGAWGGAVITMLLFPSPTSAEKILLLSNLKTDSSLAPPPFCNRDADYRSGQALQCPLLLLIHLRLHPGPCPLLVSRVSPKASWKSLREALVNCESASKPWLLPRLFKSMQCL